MSNGLTALLVRIRCLCSQDEGQGLVEYSLILALIAIAAIIALTVLGSANSSAVTSIGNQIPS